MPDSSRDAGGTLVIIGGHEDKEGERDILREVARRAHGGTVVVTTVASHDPEGYFEQYEKGFADLGLANLVEMGIADRQEACSEEKLSLLNEATGVFFTGGDQLRITSQIGGTPLMERIREIHAAGGVIAGTSAGASALCETMLVKGSGRESHRIGDLQMAPGLGLIGSVIVDQHFAERGRMGRILGAVAHNPQVLGIGIDENTAIVVRGTHFVVRGAGAVYVIDGVGASHTNIAEERTDSVLSLHNIRLHVLACGDRFDLNERRPRSRS